MYNNRLLSFPLFILSLVVMLSGCESNKPKIVPEDFIIKQNTQPVRTLLNELNENDYIVKFSKGKSAISEKQALKLTEWLQQEQPQMITIRGTGGDEKYKDLGLERGIAVINHLRVQGVQVEMIALDYDAGLAGGRVLINSVPIELVSQIRTDAPIMIVKSN